MAQQPADGGYNLELAGTFINAGYADIAVMALYVELAHIASATVNLHRLVADPVAHFGGVIFHQGGQHGCQAVGLLLPLALGWSGAFPFPLAVLVSVFQVHPAPGLADQRPRRLDLPAH